MQCGPSKLIGVSNAVRDVQCIFGGLMQSGVLNAQHELQYSAGSPVQRRVFRGVLWILAGDEPCPGFNKVM
jgi:hypothetical protein